MRNLITRRTARVCESLEPSKVVSPRMAMGTLVEKREDSLDPMSHTTVMPPSRGSPVRSRS